MKKLIAALALAVLVLAGCSPRANKQHDDKGTGTVNFNVDLPNGDMLNEVTLTIMCEGFTQTHTYDLTTGDEVSAFAGLPAGDCTVTIEGTTANGHHCVGTIEFTIIENTIIAPTVVLVCNAGPGDDEVATGGAKIGIDLALIGGECPAPRILKIFAIPANLLQGENTLIEVETQNTTAGAEITFDGDSNSDNSGAVDVSAQGTDCSAGSADCATVTCTASGAVYVDVTVSDSECNDTESIEIECLDELP